VEEVRIVRIPLGNFAHAETFPLRYAGAICEAG